MVFRTNNYNNDEISVAIKTIGKGASYDGLSGSILQFIPEKLKAVIFHLFYWIFDNKGYPLSWRKQLLTPIEKKGHSINSPKLCGITVGPLLSRLADLFLNKQFCDWYTPNPEQGGFRKKQGCFIQIFSLFTKIELAKCLNKSLFICLLDFDEQKGANGGSYEETNRLSISS